MNRKLALCLILTATAIQLGGIQPMPIPEIELLTIDGSPTKLLVQTSTQSLRGQWLILYLQSGCQSCDGLVNLLRRSEGIVNRPGKLMIVMGGMTSAELQRYMLRFPELASATWRADPARNAFRQLKLGGAPVIAGCREGTIFWTMNGSLPEPASVRAVVESWTR